MAYATREEKKKYITSSKIIICTIPKQLSFHLFWYFIKENTRFDFVDYLLKWKNVQETDSKPLSTLVLVSGDCLRWIIFGGGGNGSARPTTRLSIACKDHRFSSNIYNAFSVADGFFDIIVGW